MWIGIRQPGTHLDVIPSELLLFDVIGLPGRAYFEVEALTAANVPPYLIGLLQQLVEHELVVDAEKNSRPASKEGNPRYWVRPYFLPSELEGCAGDFILKRLDGLLSDLQEPPLRDAILQSILVMINDWFDSGRSEYLPVCSLRDAIRMGLDWYQQKTNMPQAHCPNISKYIDPYDDQWRPDEVFWQAKAIESMSHHYCTVILKDISRITKKEEDARRANCIKIALDRFPIVESDNVGRDVARFVSEPDIAEHRNRFRRWIRKVVKPEISGAELDEEIESLVNTYAHSLRSAGLSARMGRLEVLLNVAGDLIDDVIGFKVGNVAKRMFGLSRQEVHERYLRHTLPGAEVAFILEAERRFTSC